MAEKPVERGVRIFDGPGSLPGGMPPLLERLTDYLPYHARQVPDRPCLVSSELVVTWGELPEITDRLSKGLMATGVVRGDRVAVWSPPTVEGLLLFLACAQIGAMFVGINPKYQLDEIEHVLSDSDPKVLFAVESTGTRDYNDELRAIESREGPLRVVRFEIAGSTLMGDRGFEQEGADLPDSELEAAKAAVEPSDPVTIVYTSGTTGAPKGALLTSRAFAINYWHVYVERYVEWLKVPAFFTINHQAGLGDVAALAIVSGGTQYPMERFDTRELLELIEREGITYLPGLVTNFQLLFRNENLDDHDLTSLEYIWWGGALIPIDLLEGLLELAPRASTDFGQTETTGPLIFTPVDASLEDKSLTIGRPMWPFEVRLADERGKPVDPGEAGEIQARGPQLSPGYFGNPEATRALYTDDGWLRTGDLARQRDDGYMVMVGRIKEMFKSGGYNVYPAEIEAVLSEAPGVDMAVVIPVPDDLYQEVGWAFVTPRREADLDASAIEEHARAKLANYKVPKRVLVCQELPRTLVGKIDKPKLRAMASGEEPGLEALTESRDVAR